MVFGYYVPLWYAGIIFFVLAIFMSYKVRRGPIGEKARKAYSLGEKVFLLLAIFTTVTGVVIQGQSPAAGNFFPQKVHGHHAADDNFGGEVGIMAPFID